MRLFHVTRARMLVLGLIFILAAAGCSAGQRTQAPPTALSPTAPAVTSDAVTPTALKLRQDMRQLWQEHIVWTRLYIVSVAGDLADAEPAAGRLLQNQTDIANAIKPFYGDEAGAALEALLRDHILIAADLLAAAKAGDNAKVDDASARWNTNADEIAAFLSAANPNNWPLSTMQEEMRMHLSLTLEEATARLQGDWAADIAAYDKIQEHILTLADVLSTGIIAQFPEKFS